MAPQAHTSANGLPVASGIELVPTRALPDRVRAVFPFQYFNAVQSKSFTTVYNSTDNFVLSAPTGSGKTAVIELAICSFVTKARSVAGHDCKIVYQAPTKALCSERCRDWQAKFAHLNLKCEELTGDTESTQLRHVQNADILVTTPEKWDSITRKWRDHKRLMDLVKLFLIDEVHILKEDRGACLETVVSRMKSMGQDVRFIALSATIPNSADIAAWLGRNADNPSCPASQEVFSEEFRPVRLDKHIVGLHSNGNDFGFDQLCLQSLPSVIEKYSQRKPIMVFCMTRSSAEKTAASLCQWWTQSNTQARFWSPPAAQVFLADKKLQEYASSGVAYHHAGLEPSDRIAVEQGYLEGRISVICCTSTLAVGINLPCHFVIIKNTVSYQSGTMSCQEYSDLDMMQMLGRAGRPQFDTSAVAVIMTRQEKATKYERMVQGQEVLESRLHLNLIEHLNSEIGLKTVQDISSACAWLKGTFLFVRLAQNPEHYWIEGDSPGLELSARAEEICKRALKSLHELDLVSGDRPLLSTPLGDAMSRYCICFETMKLIVNISLKAKMSEILSVIAQASEFKAVRLRSTEKAMFRDLNGSPMIRFPIKVNLDLSPQKVSLIIQAVLGGLDPRSDQRFSNHQRQYTSDVNFIFLHTQRLIRCILDCQLARKDAESVRNAMELSRSLGARAWDDSPLQLSQIEKIGPVACRKLIASNIRSIEDLETVEAFKIDMMLSRNPPFGSDMLVRLQAFPKLHVSLKVTGRPVRVYHGLQELQIDPEIQARKSESVVIQVKAELGFLNQVPPVTFNRSPIQVCFLAETSDGRVLHFCKISGRNLGHGQDALFQAELHAPHQLVNGYVSCDDIAGTLRHATLDPKIPSAMFEGIRHPKAGDKPRLGKMLQQVRQGRPDSKHSSEDYGRELDDEDLTTALEQTVHLHEGDHALAPHSSAPKKTLAGTGKMRAPTSVSLPSTRIGSAPRDPFGVGLRQATSTAKSGWNPIRLPNGNWKCNHLCKNKLSCKHKCCRQGTENKPKPPKVTPEQSEVYESSNIFLAMKQRQSAASAFRQDSDEPRAGDTFVLARNRSNCERPHIDEYDFDDIDEVPSDVWNDELAPQSNSHRSDPANADRSIFVTNTSSPENQGVDTFDLSSDLPDDIGIGSRGIQLKRAPEDAARPQSKRQTLSSKPRDIDDPTVVNSEHKYSQPVVFSAIDFSPARLDDDDLFSAESDDLDKVIVGVQDPIAAAPTRFFAPVSGNKTVAINSEACVDAETGSKSVDELSEQRGKPTIQEIDALLMIELGHVANFV